MLNILARIADVVAAIKADNDGIPEVVVTIAGASGKHGHFAPNAWADRDDASKRTHEIFLAGESLARGGVGTFGTIVHELAHAYAEANGIKDTSNAGRYHNKRFKAIAEGFGLSIGYHGTIGHSPTTVPAETVARYQSVIDALDAAITMYRGGSVASVAPTGGEGQGQGEAEGAAKRQTQTAMQCPDCADPVRVSKRWFNDNPVICREHEVEFELIEL